MRKRASRLRRSQPGSHDHDAQLWCLKASARAHQDLRLVASTMRFRLFPLVGPINIHFHPKTLATYRYAPMPSISRLHKVHWYVSILSPFTEVTRHLDDALLLVESVRLGRSKSVRTRLLDEEQDKIVSGTTFCWNEQEAGIKRWTDGRFWSNSRMKGRFFIYKELPVSKKFMPKNVKQKRSELSNTQDVTQLITLSEHSLGKNGHSQFFRKKTISLTTIHGDKFHLINYYHEQDVENDALLRPVDYEPFKQLDVQGGFYMTGLDSTPLMLSRRLFTQRVTKVAEKEMENNTEYDQNCSVNNVPESSYSGTREQTSSLYDCYSPMNRVWPIANASTISKNSYSNESAFNQDEITHVNSCPSLPTPISSCVSHHPALARTPSPLFFSNCVGASSTAVDGMLSLGKRYVKDNEIYPNETSSMPTVYTRAKSPRLEVYDNLLNSEQSTTLEISREIITRPGNREYGIDFTPTGTLPSIDSNISLRRSYFNHISHPTHHALVHETSIHHPPHHYSYQYVKYPYKCHSTTFSTTPLPCDHFGMEDQRTVDRGVYPSVYNRPSDTPALSRPLESCPSPSTIVQTLCVPPIVVNSMHSYKQPGRADDQQNYSYLSSYSPQPLNMPAYRDSCYHPVPQHVPHDGKRQSSPLTCEFSSSFTSSSRNYLHTEQFNRY